MSSLLPKTAKFRCMDEIDACKRGDEYMDRLVKLRAIDEITRSATLGSITTTVFGWSKGRMIAMYVVTRDDANFSVLAFARLAAITRPKESK